VIDEGSPLSLICSAIGTPLPQIRWTLDDSPVEGYAPRRASTADYVKHGGQIVSYFNITAAKGVDGGEVCKMSCSQFFTQGFSLFSLFHQFFFLFSFIHSFLVNCFVLKVFFLQQQTG